MGNYENILVPRTEKFNNITNVTGLYNFFGILPPGEVTLGEDNKEVKLTESLTEEGWEYLSLFNENKNIDFIKNEIKDKGLTIYDFKIAVVKDEKFSHIRAILFKEKSVVPKAFSSQ